MNIVPGPLLQTIDSPDDLRKLDIHDLPQLAYELRQYIVDVVSVHGGHFAGNLGVIELTVALHYTFNTPHDKLVWDVGHQAYGHKILTGRREEFITNRTYGGLSGFPKRSESIFDDFGTGHSSTSISAALGMAIAANYQGKTGQQHVAIIGDGAMAAGQAFEALNHAGIANTDLLIILNDNSMGIDPNVGALKEYLTRITTNIKTQNSARSKEKVISADTHPSNFSQEITGNGSQLFEAFGIQYFGPVDGHDVISLAHTLQALKHVKGPKLLHVKTVKGKGYPQAELDQPTWHAPGLFDKITGEIYKKKHHTPQPPRYQEVFGETILQLARNNDKIMAVTPAMPSGSSLKIMMDQMPDRALDVGICEQHAVTLSAGLATAGMRVYCTIYSTFMQRAYDQLIHDVALQNLPVVFCLDRAGLVGEDGPTHHGVFDIAYCRAIPNLIISAPMDEVELRNLMYTAQLDTVRSPFVIRYPRGKGTTPHWKREFQEIKPGTGRRLMEGEEIAVLSYGHTGNFAAAAINEVAAKEIFPGHYDLRFAKPLDEDLLHEALQRYPKIITVEDGTVIGGIGSAVLEFMNRHQYRNDVKIMGIPDKFIEHGSQSELYQLTGIDAQNIAEVISLMHSRNSQNSIQ